MSNILYNALNGKEVKDILKLNLASIIDNNIPLLKRGNTFHCLRARLRLDTWAVPEDVPTPKDVDIVFDKVFHNFNAIAPGISEASIEQLRMEFFRNKDNLDKLLALKEEIDTYLSQYMPTLVSADRYIDDKGVPDNIRLSHNLPLHEVELDENLRRRAEMPVSYPKDKGLDYKPVDFSEGEKVE